MSLSQDACWLTSIRSLLCMGVAAFSMSLLLTGELRAQSLFGSSGALSNTATSNGGSSGFSSGGMTGGSSSGRSGGGGMMGGSSASGGSSSGNSASGAAGGGQSSLTQTSLNAGDGSLGATVGTSGFVGRGDTAGRFVGSQNASRQQVVGGAQQFSALQNRNQNANANSTPPRQLLRPQVQLGFESPLAMTPPIADVVHARIADLPAMGTRAAGVNMQLDAAGVMTLTGTVATEHDRRMLEILTSMEPGVRSVRNQMQVAP